MSDIPIGAFALRHSQTPGQFSIVRGTACVAVGKIRKGELELRVYGGECPSKAAILAALRGESPKVAAPVHADTATAPVEKQPESAASEAQHITEARAELRAMASRRRAKKSDGEE